MAPILLNQALTLPGLFILGVSVTAFYVLTRSIYLLFFHPLAKYPGPWTAAISEIPWVWNLTNTRMPFRMVELHRKYGDVVRIRPNELSFSTVQAYQDIYGHRTKGKKVFIKTELYDNGTPYPRITSVQDPAHHQHMRKSLSNAFSAKALRDQEDAVHQYLDLFIQQLGRIGMYGEKSINMSETYNWITFDIIGDLAFGESFNAVAEGKTHPWINLIIEGVFFGQLHTVRKQLPWLKLVLPFILPKGIGEKSKTMRKLTDEKSRKRVRMGGGTGRADFFDHLIQKGGMHEGELSCQATTLIVAGSETTATFLSGVTYYLLTNPDCLSKLKAEIDGTFTSYNQITSDSTTPLEYLHAVIEEGLRIFPPVSFGLPRYSPGAFIDGHYVPQGAIVSSCEYAMARDARYWRDPESFRPERWIGEGLGDNRKASQPFSTGPRACLGINLAYLEMRIILAKIIFKYDLELATEMSNWNESCKAYLLWKKPELLVKFHPRVEH